MAGDRVTRRMLVVPGAVAAALVVLVAPSVRAGDHEEPFDLSPVICDDDAGDPEPGTQAWAERDRNNILCATQRQQDNLQNPAFLAKWAEQNGTYALDRYPEIATELLTEPDRPRINPIYPNPSAKVGDPFRNPDEWAASGRGQMQRLRFVSSTGAHLVARVYAPSAERTDAPYPGIVFSPGLQSYNEVNSFFGQGMAEEGYVVLVIDPQGQGDSESCGHAPDGSITSCSGQDDIRSSIDFILSTPAAPHPRSDEPNAAGTEPFNPFWDLLDRSTGVGLGGHSQGAMRVTPVAQQDTRVGAVVSYDNLDGTLGANVPRRTPGLYFYTDYAFPLTITPRSTPPNPNLHMGIFNQLSAAGVDVMSVTTRASTHYEWGYQPFPASFPATRYGERVSFHYTLAWFDRYLKHDPGAVDRLTAHHFDGSADRSSIGAGTFDPDAAAADPTDPFAGNQPYRIAGRCVANLLSFYYHSAYWLEGGAQTSSDVRAQGCPAAPGDPGPDPALDVAIDVRPGDDGNRINTRSRGSIPVAVMGSEELDVAGIDPSNLRFGKTGEERSLSVRNGQPQCTTQDLDEDGFLDLVCQFHVADLGYDGDEGWTTADLTGSTEAGRPFRGSAQVEVH